VITIDGKNDLSYYFQILGDSNRLKIISLIGSKELSVSEIVSAMNLSQPLVSHHLKTLKESRILETNRKGPFVFYRLTNVKILDVLGLFSEILTKNSEYNDTNPMFHCPPWFEEFFM
jgi:DNA-binding transcriptional ArsR family regulator